MYIYEAMICVNEKGENVSKFFLNKIFSYCGHNIKYIYIINNITFCNILKKLKLKLSISGNYFFHKNFIFH